MGGVGLLAVAYPFIAGFARSKTAKAKGGSVTVDIATLVAGSVMTMAWRVKPVRLMRRQSTRGPVAPSNLPAATTRRVGLAPMSS